MPAPAHVLTIDLEDWYHANLMDGHVDRLRAESRVVRNMQRLLELLDETGAKATVFVLGRIAEEHPELVRQVRDGGHEIASHGYDHRLVYRQTPAEFENDLRLSMEWIERAAGVRPTGYRAPSWSITRQTLWALEIVAKLGFQYDSSIFPFRTFLYGIQGAPNRAFRLKLPVGELLEIPPSTVTFAGQTLPFSGGVYFRMLPYRVARSCFRRFSENGEPALFYTHPWELDQACPRVAGLGMLDSLIHYTGSGGLPRKLRALLRDFRFMTLKEYAALLRQRASLREVGCAGL